jgi:hypothetical protein
MQRWGSNAESCLLSAAALALCAAGCFRPPDEPLVEGPTLSVEIPTISEAHITGRDLLADALLGEAARIAHADFLATNAGTIDSEHLVALQGARVRLRPGTGVDELSDAFDGLMIFVAPEGDPTARVFLASTVAPASVGPVEVELVASRLDYEGAQTVLTAPRFIVGISGPTPLGTDRAVEFGLGIELDLALMELVTGGGH